MASELPKLEIINESPNHGNKAPESPDLDTLEMIFGKPNSTNSGGTTTGVHFTNNEKHNSNYPGNPDNKNEHSLEPDKDPKKHPLARPEMDDVDGESSHTLAPFPSAGMNNGSFDADKKSESHDGDLHDGSTETMGDHHPGHEGETGIDDGMIMNRMGEDDPAVSPMIPQKLPSVDVNTYQQKKDLAQGMMDLALLSANANQLRYVFETASTHPYYYPSLTLIALSIIFQVAVGIGLIINSRYDVTKHHECDNADKINNMTVLGVFLITIVNVFITSFSVATPTTVVGVGATG